MEICISTEILKKTQGVLVMKSIAILGGGNGAHTMAADLSLDFPVAAQPDHGPINYIQLL